MKKLEDAETWLAAFFVSGAVTLLYFYAVLHAGIPRTSFVEFLLQGSMDDKLLFALIAICGTMLIPFSALLVLRYAGKRDLTKPIGINS